LQRLVIAEVLPRAITLSVRKITCGAEVRLSLHPGAPQPSAYPADVIASQSYVTRM
jgi:hypothetical protein